MFDFVNYGKFNKKIAAEYGLNQALFVDYIWECSKRDERLWIKGSIRELSECFMYFSVPQIRLSARKCIASGLIKKENVNKTTFDRSYSYALTDKAIEIYKSFDS